ncbi:MAG: DUF423 domain-containing protein [Bacteroidia bacterium]|nr:DUF423 domain-containing protein [Bacteroidia bacterium]
MKYPSKLLQAAAVNALLAVLLGAMGAHALKPIISVYQLQIFEKGVQYHFYHALGMGIATLALIITQHNAFKHAAWLMQIGIVLFSGSLYALAIADLIAVPKAIIGPLTPIGGLFFAAAWIVFFKGSMQLKRK